MMMTTTHSIEGFEVKKVLGVVTGQSVEGVNFIKDIFAGITNTLGGKSRSYEKEVAVSKGEALTSLVNEAKRFGANGVIGVDVEVAIVPMGRGSLFMVNATGTAVVLERKEPA